MKWFCIDDLERSKKQFRYFYTEMLDQFIDNKEEINKFIKKAFKKKGNKTRKNR